MDRIQAQAAKLWHLLVASDTAATYQKTIALTWAILRESAVLAWLLLCLVLVSVDWFWNRSVQTGRNVRIWYSSFDETSANSFLSAAGQAVLSAGEAGASYVLTQAREQLGVENALEPAKPIAAKPVDQSKPSTSASDDMDDE